MNNITTLRNHLFEVLVALKDKENPMDVDRAKAVSEVAQVIINSAKIEVDYAKVTGADIGGKFLAESEKTGITTHRLRG